MNKSIIAGAIALALAGAPAPAFSAPAKDAASATEVEALKQELARLAARLQQLETQAADASAKADAAVAKQAAAEQRIADVEASNDNQTDMLAKTRATVTAADWAGKIKWKGDLRYRNETFDVENTVDRWRDRLRVRAGFDAKVSDSVSVGLQIASGDDPDPRSTNATLTDMNVRKSIRLDQAYVDWKAFPGAVVTAGKQKQPWFRPGNSLFYDGDVNPEGIALKYANPSGLFANAWGFWLRESGAAADATMSGVQLGWKAPLGFTVSVGYADYGSIQGEPVPSAATWVDSPAGNTTFNGTAACGLPAPATPTRCYQYDYELLDVGLQWDTKIGTLPFMVFAQYLDNQDPDDLNTAYTGGFLLGKAGDAHTWEFGALYGKVERDAQFGAFLDSDFAGGLTQGKGWQIRAAYAPVKNVTLNAQYFINKRNFDTAAEADYKRLQIDANFKF